MPGLASVSRAISLESVTPELAQHLMTHSNNEIVAANPSAVMISSSVNPRLGRKRDRNLAASPASYAPQLRTRDKNIPTISVDFKSNGGDAPRLQR
jgi:hypothetical protein